MERETAIESQYALLVAFQTMKERCQKLQARLTFIEEENSQLRQQSKNNNSMGLTKLIKDNENNENIDELKKQKSQLIHYILMVSSENQQLWKRLSWLSQANKSLGYKLTTISDTSKQHSPKKMSSTLNFKDFAEILGHTENENIFTNKNEHSLEEISLRLIDNIINEKSELKHQYSQIEELQSNTESLKNIGFAYPEDIEIDSLEQLKYHDVKLNQIKDILLAQQNKLKNALYNLKKIKKNETSTNGKISMEKLICPVGTQLDLDNSLPKSGIPQTNLFTPDSTLDKKSCNLNNDNVCPLCGVVYKKSVPFNLFHEHVIDHFTKEIPSDFEGLT